MNKGVGGMEFFCTFAPAKKEPIIIFLKGKKNKKSEVNG